jgi:hypothetical protein
MLRRRVGGVSWTNLTGRPEVSSGTMPPTLSLSLAPDADFHADRADERTRMGVKLEPPGYRPFVTRPTDHLIVLLGSGLEGWMLDASTDASEILAFVEMTDNADLPRSVEAIDHLLTELHEAGLIAPRARLSRAEARLSIYRSYALTPDGWARIRALEKGSDPGLRAVD